MTEENKPILAEEEKTLLLRSDLILNVLVDYVNKFPVEIGITLFVQGSILSGLLIGEKAYFEGLSNHIKTPGVFGKDFQQLIALLQSLGTSSSGNQEEQNQLENEFIHLKNAKFYSGNCLVPSDRGTYWRGRLRRVDGFSLGQLGPRY
jgi:hypothetical protein